MLKNVLLLLLLASAVYAAECEAGFRDPVRVLVLDAKYRPISNASVTFTYQKDYTTGKGYITTNVLYTDANGKVSTTLTNTEQLDSRVRCDIRLNVTYDGVTHMETITAQHHLADEQVHFDAYSLTVKAVDKFGAPLAFSPIRVNSMESTTNDRGLAYFIVNKKNDVDVAVSYRGAVVSRKISVQNDTVYTLQALLYNFMLNVIDDKGDPLGAIILVDTREYNGSSVSIQDTPLARPTVSVTYGLLTKAPEIDLSQRESYTVVFDLTPPDISGVGVQMTPDHDMVISFSVEDPNVHASGPSADDITVSYNVGGVTRTVPAFVQGGKYVAEISRPPDNSLVRFTIAAKDKEGNMETVDGEYLVQYSPQGNGTVAPPGDGNATGSQPQQMLPTDNPLLLAGAALAGLAILWTVYNYVKGLSSG
ncbi:MAG: Ig-like domain-containing protein [Candidatus ainarchaeum sp.]|nr:Ig-like domain-containing protein [Candidatus ainarchaeum sp.]